MQSLWDGLQYSYGYWQGRLSSFGVSTLLTKATNLVSLPLPFLSLVAVPLFGGSSTRMSLVFIYLTWSVLLLSHDPLTLEFYGTLFVRLIFFLGPALLFLAFDCMLPGLSKNIKARGTRHLPNQLGRNRILEIAGVAVGNVLFGVLLQTSLEWMWTDVFHLRSLIKISKVPTMPLPWSVAINLAQGFAVRGVSHYFIHRHMLHTARRSVFKTWHLRWQHSVEFPFSIVAAYDHPANYLLCTWLPTVLPAYCFRWHALTWFTFLALTSLEELFIFSGYNVLPSAILLAGMARRIEAHFDSAKSGNVGNFGHIGVMDYGLGTTCKGVDIMDDVQDEAAKHRLQERIDSAVKAALDNQQNRSSKSEQSRTSNLLNKMGGRSGRDDDDDGQRATRRNVRNK